MPQMFPLLWFFLFLFAMNSLITMSSVIHFSMSSNKISLKVFKASSPQLLWKW